MRRAMALALPSSLAIFLALGACSQGRPDSDPLPTHDAATSDTATRDTLPQDTASHDTATHDTLSHDTVPLDTGTHDTLSHDTLSHDTLSHDSGPSCNNGKREGTEACDKSDLDGKTCKSLGFVSGPLSCKSDCSFDKSACVLATGKVVISELMIDPSAVYDTQGEWIELFNAESQPIDLKGWVLSDLGSDRHSITAHLTIPPRAYLIVGNNTDKATNGGVTVAYSYGSNWHLSNTGDEVLLEDAKGASIDRVDYTKTWVSSGASISVIDLVKDNSVVSNWCPEKKAWIGSAGDFGTPGHAAGCKAP